MGWLDIASTIIDVVNKKNSSSSSSSSLINGVIGYGKQTIGGSHDHRTNKGDDRTPAQKKADKEKNKS